MPASDVTVNGSYRINSYKVSYYVDGVLNHNDTYEYGANITVQAAPTKEGYTFGGWSTIPVTMPASDVTVNGSYRINSYKVSYYVDGVLNHTDTYKYGANVTAQAAPVKEGYTFGGWSTIPATMPANDVMVNGSYRINSYKVFYYVDRVLTHTDTYEYGANITAQAAPAKEGYTFGGWSTIPATMPAKDVTVNGSFTAIPATTPANPTPVVTPTPKPTVEEAVPTPVPTAGAVTPAPTPTAEAATPTPTPELEAIPGENVPLAGNKAPAWALLNLILTIAAALASAVLIISLFGRKKSDNGNKQEIKKKRFWKTFSLVPGVGSIVAFLLTENIHNAMIWTDKWTVLMAIIAAAQLIVILLSFGKKDKNGKGKNQNEGKKSAQAQRA